MLCADHPRYLLDPDMVAEIRNHAAVSEVLGRLPDAILELIYEKCWFKLMVPRACGGLERPLPEVTRLFEALAWAEGNLSWCVNLGAGANMFAGYFDKVTAQALFSSPKACCAGSGAVSGRAVPTEGGYRVTGSWRYASGSSHATYFTANAMLDDANGQPITENGQPVFRSFLFPAVRVTVHDSWRSLGLQATASHDFSVDDVFVPDIHVFSLLEPSEHAGGPLFRFPFVPMAVLNTAVMLTGATLHFIDLYEGIAQSKRVPDGTALLAEDNRVKSITEAATTPFLEARNVMFERLEATWAAYIHGPQPSDEATRSLSEASRRAATAAREAITALYPLCGMRILDPKNELNKVWRDAMTMSQHVLLSPVAL
jgi:alkylation response protein AidB-like acyl-CoA dehydrogenase